MAHKGLWVPSDVSAKTSRRHGRQAAGTYTTDISTPFQNDGSAMPASFSWVNQLNLPIRNQGQCGSCWAHASAAVTEAAVMIASQVNTNLSTQYYTSCKPPCAQGAGGCHGDWPRYALSWLVQQTQGEVLETAYPYTDDAFTSNIADACAAPQTSDVYPLANVVSVAANTPADFQAALMKIGPLAITFDASGASFGSAYSSGTYMGTDCTTTPDHAVTLMGWDTDSNGQAYWIVQNSWGAGWGIGGLFWIARDMTAGSLGACGMYSQGAVTAQMSAAQAQTLQARLGGGGNNNNNNSQQNNSQQQSGEK